MPTNTTPRKGTGDSTYGATNDTLDAIAVHIEDVINTDAVNAATGLADALPAMLPDDSETVGHISDAAAHLQAAEKEQQAAQDAIAAAKSSHEKNFQAGQEAADATGHVAEREYHAAG